MSGTDHNNRLKFFGLNDYGTFWQEERLIKLLGEFDETRTLYTINDIVELNNLALFLENGLLPRDITEISRQRFLTYQPKIKRIVGKFLKTVDEAKFAQLFKDVDFQYHIEVLDLLAIHKVYQRCAGSVVISALQGANFSCVDFLSCQQLVHTYDEEIRDLLLSTSQNAELVVSKFFGANERHAIYLPKSFTPTDSRALFDRYLDEDEPNLNFVRMIASARANKNYGVNAKLKLKAQRKSDALTKKLFESDRSFQLEMGCEVGISDSQVEEILQSVDGMVGKYSYSRRWLTANLDYPTILNNFIYLFGFANDHMLLELPAYPARLGIFERFMITIGKETYRTGPAFRLQDEASFLQTLMYERFLSTQDVQIEEVISWFFTGYLEHEFGAKGFKYRPSSTTASYLEKSRQVFSEMESVLKQFSLYVEDGELDPELLTVTSEQLSYPNIPSLLDGKYAYMSGNKDIARIQNLLFSDQSDLTYISEELRANSFASLIVTNRVSYNQFHDYQKHNIDFLCEKGILAASDSRIFFPNVAQCRVLKELWDYETVSYHHCSQKAQDTITVMERQGWLERRSSLLDQCEATYFNYFLNDKEFSDGPALRNRYLHGSQADGEDNQIHRNTYIIALRLLIALIIKINDDFCLADSHTSSK